MVFNDNTQVAPLLKDSLKRLEYRGYDSVGLATISEGKIYIKKDKGKIDEVDARITLTDLPGNIGIGHTRWATHGAVSKINAHPHHCCTHKLTLVHNGIVENFLELREEIESKYGHEFISECDTEVLPHLIEINLRKRRVKLKEAVVKALEKVRGEYALAILHEDYPRQIIVARKDSPLVIGVGSNAVFAASDIPAFLHLTNRAIILEDEEIAVLTPNNVEIYKLGDPDTIVSRKPMTIEWTSEMAQKGGMPHFMLKEIHEQPRAIRNTLLIDVENIINIANTINNAKKVFITAAGTSYHAGLAGSYIFNSLTKTNNRALISSEFIDKVGNVIDDDSVVLGISQSGESMDTLSAVKFAKKAGAKILSITNVVGSSITRLSDHVINTQAGPEIGVAATKTFLVQLISLSMLGMQLGKIKGIINQSEFKDLKHHLDFLPDIVQKTIINQEENIKNAAEQFSNKENFLFLGRGINTATASEGALKLKEISYIHAESYPAGESKHGPIALIEENFPVVFVAPPDDTQERLITNIMEMKARGAKIISVVEIDDLKIQKLSDVKF
ncbi:MAG: glutamine--fructose-6-phosphate transaminase (isomerizing), partial [Candidatus Helarchaeota archaeon]|nr:glutamine--fructose-6-phosphate transaminase (isomerizing) [Candidatus Helarchaeota archaeon]